MESPFRKHRDKVLGHYSTASWLRGVVMAMWNGSAHPVGLSKLTNLDAEHFAAFVDMVSHYRKVGENDPAFERLVRDVEARLAAEQQAVAREADLEVWLRAVKQSLRLIGKPTSLVEDRYEWFSVRFDAGDTPEAAAAACPPLATIA
jgi:hypothetical protein